MQFLSDNPALRSHLASQVDFLHEFSQKAFDTARQLSEMNLKLARQTIEGSLHATASRTETFPSAALVVACSPGFNSLSPPVCRTATDSISNPATTAASHRLDGR